MADVFVSYTAQDRDRVGRLVEALRASGLTVWWDRGIGIGSTFDREIERELDDAGCVVVVWSTASIDSEWVRNEAYDAQARDVFVPILFDAVKPPLAFRRAQTANMIDWPATTGEFGAMLSAVRGKLNRTAHSPSSPPRGARDIDAPSVAVLPLANVSPDPEQVHFVDGLTIELIHRLAKIPGLHVAGQTSSFAHKGRTMDHAQLAAALGVGHLLEGSVRRAGAELRITLQLVNAATGFQLWSADFDRHLDDVFAIQRDISEAVAGALSIELRGTTSELLGGTRNPAAHAHYLRGNALYWAQTDETTERAIIELEHAVALDANFSTAWVVLSTTYGQRARQRDRTEDALQDMGRAVERALATEPLLWRAHSAKGWYLLSRRRFVEADAAMVEAKRLQRAQESIAGPNLKTYLHQVGRLADYVDEARRLQLADPVLGTCQDVLHMLGRTEEARETFATFKGLAPLEDRIYLSMLAMEQTNAAVADGILPGFSASQFGRDWFGSRDPVRSDMQKRLIRGERRRGEFVSEAMLAAHHGDHELAIEFLRAEFLVDGFGAFFLMWHPQLATVRATPAFKQFLIELGLPEMWRKTGNWGDFAKPLGDHDFVSW